MPKINRDEVYNAIYESACKKFVSQEALEPYLISEAKGEPLYRYVGYRSSMPQAENAGRIIWSSLENDKSNRWTGIGAEDKGGSQGLYLSGEYLDKDKPFPELEHYLDKDSNPNASVNYFRYEAGQEPALTTAKVSELRSMFLFSLEKSISGVNLSLNEDGNHPLLEEILEDAQLSYPDAFTEEDTLSTLYYSGEDASFCRAIGNAVLESTDLSFFETTSVRDRESSNVIMRAETKTPLLTLKPEGRSSFFLNSETMQGEGVFTIADLVYNAEFEDPTAHTVLPSKEELNTKLTEISQQIANNLVDAYDESLREIAPTEAMQEVGEQIATIKEHLKENNIEEGLTEIGAVKQRMYELLSNKESLEAFEANAFEVVDSVMGSLSDITTAIDNANKEIADPTDHNSEGGVDVDISDPTENEVDPVIEGAKD